MSNTRLKIGGTGRREYDKNAVKQLRANRKKIKAKKEGITDEILQNCIGDLRAAGHLKITALGSFNIDNTECSVDSEPTTRKTITMKITTYTTNSYGESPHIRGYLESASDADLSRYKLRGWINDDGTIRLEIVK